MTACLKVGGVVAHISSSHDRPIAKYRNIVVDDKYAISDVDVNIVNSVTNFKC
jgi:hypothetical protein